MSFYVLELAVSTWLDNQVLDVMPYRITWENGESGQNICETFAKLVGESATESLSDVNQEVRLGYHFYKYGSPFDYANPDKTSRPKVVSNSYFPSKTLKGMDIPKIVRHALSELESPKKEKKVEPDAL
jgi:hypothetical protein